MIPESQLDTWAHQGAVTTASETRASIYNALQGTASVVRDRAVDVYLQGSYGNDTNIRGASDIDVVAELQSVFYYDVDTLSPPERADFDKLPNVSYTFAQYRDEVLRTLVAYYGQSAVTSGNKSIKVAGVPGQRLPADVVPCFTFKKYSHYPPRNGGDVVEGIKFFCANDHRAVVNFPKRHRENGTAKNSAARSNGWFKGTVRMVKNARKVLVEKGVLTSDVAPSYFVECFVYNLPDYLFGPSWQDTYSNLVKWAASADLRNLVCQNEQQRLFGPTPEQWDEAKAKRLVEALAYLWNRWNW